MRKGLNWGASRRGLKGLPLDIGPRVSGGPPLRRGQPLGPIHRSSHAVWIRIPPRTTAKRLWDDHICHCLFCWAFCLVQLGITQPVLADRRARDGLGDPRHVRRSIVPGSAIPPFRSLGDLGHVIHASSPVRRRLDRPRTSGVSPPLIVLAASQAASMPLKGTRTVSAARHPATRAEQAASAEAALLSVSQVSCPAGRRS
jgi:hypothetical protein